MNETFHIEANLRNMKVHERLDIDKTTSVLRVPGGWIYTFVPPNDKYHFLNSVFVPYS